MTTISKRVGLIQTRGIGDIIIALPIADYFEELGFEVIWPIDERFVPAFTAAKPSITFLPVPAVEDDPKSYFLTTPLDLLAKYKCERTIILYSYFGSMNICDTRLSAALKFDEYKYAVSGVPFDRKWSMKLERDMVREQDLFKSLNIEEEYVCFHGQGSDMINPLTMPLSISKGMRVVNIESLTDRPFDWLLTLERATKLVLIDSCFSNLVEQMNLGNDKSLILRSPVAFTPVYKNNWKFLSPDMFI